MSLKEKLQAMSIATIVRYMIKGALEPMVPLNTKTFGESVQIKPATKFLGWVLKDPIYEFQACIATNALCHVHGENLAEKINLWRHFDTPEGITTRIALRCFDNLRAGLPHLYNAEAKNIGLALIPEKYVNMKLPVLFQNFTIDRIQPYETFANLLEME